jgi:acetyl coenzyme A synthetase (ADP forming)-like protein
MDLISRLNRAFYPRNIVIIGASRSPSKFGHWLFKAILEHGFRNRVYPVNPEVDEILGIKTYKNVRDIEEDEIDLAIVALPAAKCPQAIRELGEKKTNVAIVIASGFSEVGEEGRLHEEELLKTAREEDIRILGPNTLGIVNTSNKLVACFGRAIISRKHKRGSIAFITQSGAFGQALLSWAEDEGIGFSKFINTGNECDLTSSDLLEYLAQDKDTKVILMYIEGLRDPRRFLDVARKTTAEKPVIVVKVGRTESGSRAALSHTGSLAGSDRIYSAMFKQCGVLRVEGHEEMFDTARALLYQPIPSSNQVAILTSSGGLGVELADECEMRGLKVPILSEGVQKSLMSFLPKFAAVSNPVDMTSQVHLNQEWWGKCMDILLASEEVDSLAIGVSALTDIEISRQIIEVYKKYRKPVLVTWVMGKRAKKAMKLLERNGIPVYPSPERLVKVLANLYRYSRMRARFRKAIGV